MARMMVPRLRVALFISALAGALALGVAFASEWWGGLVPCALCLVERWPYRVALVLGLIGLVLPRGMAWMALILVWLGVLFGAVVGGVHVGVEQGWWPSPLPECMAPRLATGSIAQRLASMPATPSKACEDPSYLIQFVPVSFAQMSVIYALMLLIGLAIFMMRTRRRGP